MPKDFFFYKGLFIHLTNRKEDTELMQMFLKIARPDSLNNFKDKLKTVNLMLMHTRKAMQ